MRKASPSGHDVNISTHREPQSGHLEPARISHKLLAELGRKMSRTVIFICGAKRAGEDGPKTGQTPKDHYLNRASGMAKIRSTANQTYSRGSRLSDDISGRRSFLSRGFGLSRANCRKIAAVTTVSTVNTDGRTGAYMCCEPGATSGSDADTHQERTESSNKANQHSLC